jgi:hypothetical protein
MHLISYCSGIPVREHVQNIVTYPVKCLIKFLIFIFKPVRVGKYELENLRTGGHRWKVL